MKRNKRKSKLTTLIRILILKKSTKTVEKLTIGPAGKRELNRTRNGPGLKETAG